MAEEDAAGAGEERCGRSSPSASSRSPGPAHRGAGPPRSPPPGAPSPGPRPSPRCGRSAPSAPAIALRAASGAARASAPRTCSPAAPSLSTFTSSVAERRAGPRPLELEVAPPSPYALPRFGGEDRVMTIRDGVATRLLRVEGSPVLVRAWQPGRGRVALRAEPVDPAAVSLPPPGGEPPAPARSEQLSLAAERMRFALGVDDDLGEFYRRFRRDPLLGPLIRRRPHLRAAAAALALGGARLGGRQAADRVRPGGPNPATHRRPLGPAAGPRARLPCATSRPPS